MLFFDYDGVIGDTEEGLFDDYLRMIVYRPTLTKEIYLAEMDWYEWLRERGPKGDSFEIIKSHDPKDAKIFTKCWSLNEAREKVCYIREVGIKNDIIICPGGYEKTQIICPKGNMLVEDNIKNARDWKRNGGTAFILGGRHYKDIITIYDLEEAYGFYYKCECEK